MTSASAEAPRVRPRRYGRMRLALCALLERVFSRLAGRALYRRRSLAAGRFRVRREQICVPGLPAGLQGLTIAQLSDLHAGPFLGEGDLGAVVDACNQAAPDVVVLTGDLITSRWEDALLVLPDLARLQAPLGRYAVFGNHDYHDRQEGRIEAAYSEVGLRFLRDACVRIETDAGVLALVGLEDLQEARQSDVSRARASIEPGDVEVLLCHNPEAAPSLARSGCAAILSGHTHGGQLDLPLLRRLGPPHPGDRVQHGSSTLIVSRGLGALVLPLRLCSPAELVLVELQAGQDSDVR